jgi:type IV pilus assembly protein PilW
LDRVFLEIRVNSKRIYKNVPCGEGGFTLVELLVVMAIVGVVMTGIYMTYVSQQKSYTVQEEVAAMQQQLRAAMYYMVSEIRMAGFDPTGTAGAGITTMGPDNIEFTMDSRGDDTDDPSDGDTDDPGETITYSLSGTDLRRATSSNTAIARNISNISFIYRDGWGNVTASATLVRSVDITIRATTGNPHNPRSRQMTTRVRCRNIGI